jgi:hypothetical protein
VSKGRFILRYRGDGTKPEADVARVHALPDAVVVDDSSPRMLLVDSDPERLRALVDDLQDWVVAPDQSYAIPDTRRKVERPPDP